MTRERIERNGHGESSSLWLDQGRGQPLSNGRSEVRVPAPVRENVAPAAFDLGNDEELFLRTEQRIPVRRGSIAKRTATRLKAAILLAMTAFLTGCLAVAAYSYSAHAPAFRLESSNSIAISGLRNASRAQIMDVASSDIGRNIFFIPLQERRKQLEQIPWVESAAVMRLLPNRLAVSIAERTPVAFVLLGSLLNSKTSLIDANGVILGPPANRQTKFEFPVIRGIAEAEALSSRAAAMNIYSRLMSELDSGAPDHLYTRQLSEIDLSDPEDVKATVSDDGGTVLIHLGDSDFLERYKLFAAHIAEWRRQYRNVQSVDLRYEGQIIVNPDDGGAASQADLADPAKPLSPKTPAAQAKPAMRHPARPLLRQKKQKRRSRRKWER